MDTQEPAPKKRHASIAEEIADGPVNPETTTALRKLLEAKDCAVRAVLYKDPPA